jgi:flagellar hook-associated protein 1 FlgK
MGGISDITIAIGGATINDVLSQLNNPVTGMGRYASFALDAKGALVMTPVAGAEQLRVDLVGDSTQRGATGTSFSQLFGLGHAARAGRADMFAVRADIAANPGKLAAAAPDIRAAALGAFVLGAGDGRGALKLSAALNTVRDFASAGAVAGGAMSVSDFAARLAGDVGARAARAERNADSAQILMDTATEQRSSLEGVNLDEELANMTLYQQSYNASARLLQAAKEMIDTLLSVV